MVVFSSVKTVEPCATISALARSLVSRLPPLTQGTAAQWAMGDHCLSTCFSWQPIWWNPPSFNQFNLLQDQKFPFEVKIYMRHLPGKTIVICDAWQSWNWKPPPQQGSDSNISNVCQGVYSFLFLSPSGDLRISLDVPRMFSWYLWDTLVGVVTPVGLVGLMMSLFLNGNMVIDDSK